MDPFNAVSAALTPTHPQSLHSTTHPLAHHHDNSQTVLGSGAVGKSSLTASVCGGNYSEIYDPTIEDLYTMTFNIDGVDRSVDILDTAGQDEFVSLLDQWMREGDGFLLVYSVIDEQSFTHVQNLVERIARTKGAVKPPIVIVGNKCDLPADQHEVSEDQGRAFAEKCGYPFFETSALTKVNANACFQQLVKAMTANKAVNRPPTKPTSKKCTIL